MNSQGSVDRSGEGPGVTSRPGRYGPSFWLQVLFGLAVATFGGWKIYDRGRSPTGFLIACVGVMIMPLGVTRLVGGLGAAGLGVWLIVNAGGPIDYLYGALVVFVGGSSAAEGVRTLRRRGV